jgi:uncharacterized membrane protein
MHVAGLDGLLVLFGLVPTALFAVVIFGEKVITSRRGVPRGHGIRHPGEEALLLERFVRGEIDDDEYRVHREALRSAVPEAR